MYIYILTNSDKSLMSQSQLCLDISQSSLSVLIELVPAWMYEALSLEASSVSLLSSLSPLCGTAFASNTFRVVTETY